MTEENENIQSDIFTKDLYRLLIFYERIDILETCFKLELKYGSKDANLLLLDCFTYCLKSNHIIVCFHLVTKYAVEFTPLHAKMINSL